MFTLEWLIRKLEFEKEMLNSLHTHPDIVDVLAQFLDEIRMMPPKRGHAHHQYLQHSESMQKFSALHIFVRHFDALLSRIFPVGGIVAACLEQKGCGLPLASHFLYQGRKPVTLRDSTEKSVVTEIRSNPKDSILRVAKGLLEMSRVTMVIIESEDRLNHLDYDWYRCEAESLRIACIVLETIARLGPSPATARSMMNRVSRSKPTNAIRFCDFCFRRAEKSSVHCKAHRNSGVPEDDSRYKRAQRYQQKMSTELHEFYDQVRSLGLVMMLPEKKSVVYHGYGSDIIKLINDLGNKDWEEIKHEWWRLIKWGFPVVHSCLTEKTLTAESWLLAVKGIWKDLDNDDETNTDPSFVIYLLMAAEEWLSLELPRTVAKTAKQPSTAEIIRLYQLGNLKQIEIAAELGCSRAWVSKVIKEAGIK